MRDLIAALTRSLARPSSEGIRRHGRAVRRAVDDADAQAMLAGLHAPRRGRHRKVSPWAGLSLPSRRPKAFAAPAPPPVGELETEPSR